MNDNERRTTSQGASGRRNPGMGSGDSERDQGSSGQGSGSQGSGGQGSSDQESGAWGSGGLGSGGRGRGRGTDGRGAGRSGFGGRGSGGWRSGGWRSGGWQSGGWSFRSGGFRSGLPNLFIAFAVFAFLFGAFASCRASSGPGQVAGQIQALSADRTVYSLAGAQVILRGGENTYTTVSTEVPEGAEGTDAYNYRFDNVPPGRYTMAVTPPADSSLQSEADITLEVESDELFPQSVMLLAEGIQKPRPLSPSELNPGEVGYLNERGESVVYQQGSGLGLDDALLMYLLFRNPPGFGYGAPPIIYSPPRPGGSAYRWDTPPSRTSTGGRVTSRPPSVPGQGSTRPSSGAATGAGPTYRSGDSADDASRPPASSNGTGSSGTTTSPANRPSQGVTRPSSSSSRSSSPARSGGSRSSGGGRR